jgi:hypothetical protein
VGTSLLLLVSISIKYATALLIPVCVLIYAQRKMLRNFLEKLLRRVPFSHRVTQWASGTVDSWVGAYVPLVCSVVLFTPLLSARSQYFQPWYLIWSLSWMPLIKQRWWRIVLLLFSLSSAMRYLPWIYDGGFKEHTVLSQQLVTWGVPAVVLLLAALVRKWTHRTSGLNNV